MIATVLVVDDSRVMQQLARMTLEPQGYQVVAARGLPDVLDAFEQHPRIALVLLDVSLGEGADSGTVAEHVRARSRGRAIPVVLQSGLPEAELAAAAEALGADGYFRKGDDAGRLLRLIAGLIATATGEERNSK